MGDNTHLDMNDPATQRWIVESAETQADFDQRRLKLQDADRDELASKKALEALLQAPKYDPTRGGWQKFLWAKMRWVGTDWIRGPVRLPAKVATHIRKMRVEFGDDVDAAWAVTEPLQLRGIREFGPFFNAFMIAGSTVSINTQGDLIGELDFAGEPRGITETLVSPDVADTTVDDGAEMYRQWLSEWSPLDQEIWALYNSVYFSQHGYRGIEQALTADLVTGEPPIRKSSIQRHVKAMEASLIALSPRFRDLA
jgi:hypothetical protein